METKFQLSNVPGFVPNLNSAEQEWATYNLTDFQMQHAVAIRARADFAHWVTAGPIAASKLNCEPCTRMAASGMTCLAASAETLHLFTTMPTWPCVNLKI